MDELAAHASLFLASFLAATLLPGSSEALLSGLVIAQAADPWALLATASIGNVLGSILNWICGRLLARFSDRRWFPASPAQIDRAGRWFERYGLWSLLFAWAPLIGDPLTVIAGVLRVRLLPFILLVAIGKTGRYLFVLAAILWWQGG